MSEHLLTKSRFVAGQYCPALLWFLANASEELPEADEAAKARMQQGTEVGVLAQQAFPGGEVVEGDFFDLPEITSQLISEKEPLFEAAFIHERAYCKIDVLEPLKEGYRVVEVKSSSKVKNEHLLDVAFQVWLARKAGVDVQEASVMHINTSYVREGALDVNELFTQEDVTESVKLLLEDMDVLVEKSFAIMNGNRPTLEAYHLCENPNDCPLHCFDELPEHNVTELYYNNGKKFLEQGTQTIQETQGVGLNKKQTIQYEAIKNNQAHVNKKKLSEWLESLEYPRIHLDFETINPAIPPFSKTSPYEQIPFQYSVHVEHKDHVEHHEFLGDGATDPREELVKQLIQDIPSKGSVLAHNKSFEKRVLQALKNNHPEHEEAINKVLSRLEDTITPFRNFWYYHPAQHGSCSIKNVLPALTNTNYEGMQVANGQEAQQAYSKLVDNPGLRKPMLEYCKQDTQAMIDILQALRAASK